MLPKVKMNSQTVESILHTYRIYKTEHLVLTPALQRTQELLISNNTDILTSIKLLNQCLIETVDPADKMVLHCDRTHGEDVLRWTLKLKPDADIPLQIAALLHDIERWNPEWRTKALKDEKADETYRKQVLHPLNSKRVAQAFFQGFDVPEEIVQKTLFLIEHHDQRCSKPVVLPTISGDRVLIDSYADHIWEADLELLKQADSAAFFDSGLSYFVTHCLDVRKATQEKVAQRLATNFGRMRGSPVLQELVKQHVLVFWRNQDQRAYEIFVWACM
eukprot:TRINITY_DN4630_c0_g1_i1.p1 TRINITY_DN4630_c0_g1~~TRINITY_DN4630_c0_g1_i1.p1  ORF type:complete len:275 (+),score=44.38 TRINITY_DN4630_c0_g1_i1:131-955(+)